MFSDSSSDSDDEEEDDEDEDEEDGYEEALERELQAKLIESDQYEAKEGASSISKLEEKPKGWDRVSGSAQDWL